MVGGWGLRQSLEGDEGRGGGRGRLRPNHGRLRAVGAPRGCAQGNGGLRFARYKEQTSCRVESGLGKAGSREVTSEPMAFIRARADIHLDWEDLGAGGENRSESHLGGGRAGLGLLGLKGLVRQWW